MARKTTQTKSASQVRREAERKLTTALRRYIRAANHEGIEPHVILETIRELAIDVGEDG